MINYFFEVSICWLGFYLLYALLLSKETFFQLNRFYLLGTVITGLIIPLLEYPTITLSSDEMLGYYLHPITVTVQSVGVTLEEIVVTPNQSFVDPFSLISGLYWIIIVVLSGRFLYGLSNIFTLYKTGTIEQKTNYALIKTHQTHSPFSFFSYLFWSQSLQLQPTETEKIITHELTHIQEKHSWDIILLEVLCILFWFNPLIYLYKNSIRTVHEYLADASVLKTTHKKQYGQLLLKQSQSGIQVAFANNFIHSQLKKRFKMMMKAKSSRPALLKYLWLLPIAICLIFAFSNPYTQAHLNDWKISNQESTSGDFDPVTIKKQFDKVVAQFQQTASVKNQPDVINQFNSLYANLINQYPNHQPEIDAIAQDYRQSYKTFFEIPTHHEGGKVYTEVDQMAVFAGCETKNGEDQKACSINNLMNFIYGNIKYPKEAHQNGTQGQVLVRFIVDKDGDIKEPTIVNAIGSGCDEEVLRVVNLMPKWTPASKHGELVKVYYHLPVKFKLADDEIPAVANTESKVDNAAEKIEETEEEIVFKTVDEMPRFPGCENLEGEKQKTCSQTELLMFIYKNIKYPEVAREEDIQGTVIVSFIVDTDGQVIAPSIKRSIGGGCDEEVIKVVNSMPMWIPGKNDGIAVKTEFNLPVKFKLEGSAKSDKVKTDDLKSNQLNLKNFVATPNPTSGKVQISFETTKGPLKLDAVDINGKSILSINLGVHDFQGDFNATVDLSRAAKGPVVITIRQEGKTFSETIMVQ